MVEMYEPSKHVSTFFVAGFQHHDGALVFDRMKVGAPVELVAERDNPHDPEAMALVFDGTMIGYVPRDEGGMLSTLDYYGHGDVFEARIMQLDSEADPWRQVRVGVYVRDAR